MRAVNSCAESPGAMLLEICKEFGDWSDNVDGLLWFLQHPEHPEQIPAVFPKHEPQQGGIFLGSILEEFMGFGNFGLQKLVTLFDCSFFTRDMVTNAMLGNSFCPRSGKTMKKINCMEWLIDSFGITLDEVIDMLQFWLLHMDTSYQDDFDFTLETWKMILHKFPRIDADVIRSTSLMLVAVNSPSVAAFTMRKFGITIDEIRRQVEITGNHSS
ncbi:hypothetical protein Pelo_1439 [Pelomyxa schiedti]|nr:hypothetical protein Pelo_1439 [Pelomyxa schiedti]